MRRAPLRAALRRRVEIMKTAKKMANANNDNEGKASTRATGGSKAAKVLARKVNRAAIRKEKRAHTKESAGA